MNKVSRLAAALTLSAVPAFAGAVTINFTDVSQLQNERSGSPYAAGPYNFLVASNGGITATARAGYWDGSGNLASDYTVNSASYEGSTINTTNYPYPRLYSWSGGGGLGVYSASNDAQHTVDNKGHFDFVRFGFDVPVTISAVTLSCVGCDFDPNDGDASYRVGGVPQGTWTDLSWTSGSPFTFSLPGVFVDTSEFFYFGASRIFDQYCKEYDDGACERWKTSYDDFKIQSLTLDFTPPERTPPEEVPEPATLASLAIGALAMAAGRRRRPR